MAQEDSIAYFAELIQQRQQQADGSPTQSTNLPTVPMEESAPPSSLCDHPPDTDEWSPIPHAADSDSSPIMLAYISQAVQQILVQMKKQQVLCLQIG